MSPSAVLVDFGGVLTSSVLEAFRSFSVRLSGDPALFVKLFRSDERAAGVLAEHECGLVSQAVFEERVASILAERGITVPSPGFVDSFQALLEPDAAMLDAVARLRARGVPVALVSNSLGDDCYRGYDLAALADVVVVSSQVGVRKPSRRIYEIACERLEVAPAECVLVDDLEHNLAGAARLGIAGLHHVDSARTIRALSEWFGI